MRSFLCQAALHLSYKQMMDFLRSLDISVGIFNELRTLIIVVL